MNVRKKSILLVEWTLGFVEGRVYITPCAVLPDVCIEASARIPCFILHEWAARYRCDSSLDRSRGMITALSQELSPSTRVRKTTIEQ